MQKRPMDVRVTLRIDKRELAEARKLAKQDSRNLTDWLRLAIQRQIEAEKKSQKQAS